MSFAVVHPMTFPQGLDILRAKTAIFMIQSRLTTIYGSALLLLIGSGSGRAGDAIMPRATIGTPSQAAVTVYLASGREFCGDVARETDGNWLWLQSGRNSVSVLRPIAWQRVVKADVLGRQLTGAYLREAVETIRRSLPPPEPRVWPRLVLQGEPFSRAPSTVARQSHAAGTLPGPVRHLAIEAMLGAWNDTVEADGLLIYIYPVDAQGRLVPLRGTLDVDLTGVRTSVTPLRQPFFTLGRWTNPVRPEDFGPRGALCRLPFQAVHPEFDTALSPRGAVHARLTVPGQGTFDATASTTRIRPASPFRDDLERATGTRFLPEERVSRWE